MYCDALKTMEEDIEGKNGEGRMDIKEYVDRVKRNTAKISILLYYLFIIYLEIIQQRLN